MSSAGKSRPARSAFVFPVEGAVPGSIHMLPDSQTRWTKDSLVAATGGEWVVPPPLGWQANGVAITPGRVRPGVLVCHSPHFFSTTPLSPLVKIASGIICENGKELTGLGLPLLEVADMDNALYGLARYARDRFCGTMIALTGSVGKTGTSYLMSDVLSTFGPVEHSRASGNSPRATAGLLASISPDIPFWVTEISLNGPALVSSFVRPHIAVVLAISPAHLVYWKDVRQVALRKSGIFSGMEEGGYAILNRDMREYETVAAEAGKKKLTIIPYGEHEEADFRLLEYAKGKAAVSVHDTVYRFPCALPPHMRLNMLAVLAVAHTLGHPLRKCFPALRNPELLPGRGRRHAIRFEGKKITVIDDSYNANPDSMRAALQGLCFAAPRPSSRVAVLGDIAELGATEVEKHLELVDPIKNARLSRLLLCGPLMRHVWERLDGAVKGKWFPTPEELQAELSSWLKSGDVIAFKSSGHRLGGIVSRLLERNQHLVGQDEQIEGCAPSVAFGGNVNLGRRQNGVGGVRGSAYALGSVNALREADVSVVSLACVAASQGQRKVEKDLPVSLYFRARPEQLDVLRQAGIGMVATANHHSGDYGAGALREQLRHLDAMGIFHAGSGKDVFEASAPVYVRVREYTAAFFAVDTTSRFCAADTDRPGNWHLPLYNPDLWYKECSARIAEARKKAHIVFFIVHGNIQERTRPGPMAVSIGRAVINAGADAVLGSSPQTCPALEIYKERPIIYGAGDLLSDSQNMLQDAGMFTLALSPQGVSEVRFLPLLSGEGRTVPAGGEDAARNVASFMARSGRLGTTITGAGDHAYKKLRPRRRSILPLRKECALPVQIGPAPRPLQRPRAEWTLREVPPHLAIEPVSFGPLVLHGYWIPSTSREIYARRPIWVESYWSVQEQTGENFLLNITAGPVGNKDMPRFGGGMWYEPCDWMWPTSRWEPGTIYRDVAMLLPPPLSGLRPGELEVVFRAKGRGAVLGSHTLPTVLSLNLCPGGPPPARP